MEDISSTKDLAWTEYLAERLAADKGVRWRDLFERSRELWRSIARKQIREYRAKTGLSAESSILYEEEDHLGEPQGE